jgi:hypothetical protein
LTSFLWASVGLVAGFVGGVASILLALYLQGHSAAERLLREITDDPDTSGDKP